jgi:hypothetical protein
MALLLSIENILVEEVYIQYSGTGKVPAFYNEQEREKSTKTRKKKHHRDHA